MSTTTNPYTGNRVELITHANLIQCDQCGAPLVIIKNDEITARRIETEAMRECVTSSKPTIKNDGVNNYFQCRVISRHCTCGAEQREVRIEVMSTSELLDQSLVKSLFIDGPAGEHDVFTATTDDGYSWLIERYKTPAGHLYVHRIFGYQEMSVEDLRDSILNVLFYLSPSPAFERLTWVYTYPEYTDRHIEITEPLTLTVSEAHRQTWAGDISSITFDRSTAPGSWSIVVELASIKPGVERRALLHNDDGTNLMFESLDAALEFSDRVFTNVGFDIRALTMRSPFVKQKAELHEGLSPYPGCPV